MGCCTSEMKAHELALKFQRNDFHNKYSVEKFEACDTPAEALKLFQDAHFDILTVYEVSEALTRKFLTEDPTGMRILATLPEGKVPWEVPGGCNSKLDHFFGGHPGWAKTASEESLDRWIEKRELRDRQRIAKQKRREKTRKRREKYRREKIEEYYRENVRDTLDEKQGPAPIITLEPAPTRQTDRRTPLGPSAAIPTADEVEQKEPDFETEVEDEKLQDFELPDLRLTDQEQQKQARQWKPLGPYRPKGPPTLRRRLTAPAETSEAPSSAIPSIQQAGLAGSLILVLGFVIYKAVRKMKSICSADDSVPLYE